MSESDRNHEKQHAFEDEALLEVLVAWVAHPAAAPCPDVRARVLDTVARRLAQRPDAA